MAKRQENKKSVQEERQASADKKRGGSKLKRRLISYFLRLLLLVFTTLILTVGGLLGALYVVFLGPSQTARDMVVTTLLETSALKFVPRIYFTEEEVAQIVASNTVIEPEEEIDTSLVVVRKPEEKGEQDGDEEDIEIIEIKGMTYRGWMMIVKDPSRVTVGVSRKEGFREDVDGKQLHEIIEAYGAVAGINGGAFSDSGGMGNGGMPLGVVISDGNLMKKATTGSRNTVIGFDQDNKLLIGKFTSDQALELGMRDAVSFGPALVVNGEPAVIEGASSGLNPRTAIGQRADGAVLMLVIDGRQVNSLGASMADLIDIMMQYGAVNAANLDGGSSSNLYYEGEYINDGVALTGARDIPTTFIVR